MKTKIDNPRIAAQVVEILAEKGVVAFLEGDRTVVSDDPKAIEWFPLRTWEK